MGFQPTKTLSGNLNPFLALFRLRFLFSYSYPQANNVFFYSERLDMSISNVSEDEIRTALTYIDATDRLTWLRVGTALKTEFGESGFNLFD